MKKLVVLVLATGVSLHLLAQIAEVDKSTISPEKWIISPVKGLKKGMGRLNLNFPDGVDWSVDIYNGNKFIINRSLETYKLKYHDLTPGFYNFKLNTVLVENVEVQEGHITLLKTGVLEINSHDWELRNESSQKFLTSGNKPKKIALPAGKYQLIEGKNPPRIVEIGEVLIKSAGQTRNPVSDKWVIYAVPEYALPDNKGSLNLQFSHSQFAFTSHWIMRVYNKSNYMVHAAETNNGNFINHILDTGLYRVVINGIGIKDVPILPGKETRIKKGAVGLGGFPNGKWEVREKESNSFATNNIVQNALGGTTTFTSWQQVHLPVNDYIVSFRPEFNAEYPINYALKITDSSWTDLVTFFSQHRPFGSTYWSMRQLPDYPENKGRLFCDYPIDVPWIIKVYAQNDSNVLATYASSSKKMLEAVKFVSLPEATYDISLNNCRINAVMISRGYETKFKTGIVSIESPGNWSIIRQYKTWYGSTLNQLVMSGDQPRKILLPVGEYTVNLPNAARYHEVKEESFAKF